jgi:hypothetical protein
MNKRQLLGFKPVKSYEAAGQVDQKACRHAGLGSPRSTEVVNVCITKGIMGRASYRHSASH